MAENWPQDSSGSQETSQDSGVSYEGQLFNPTGENTIVQSNQNSQVPTTQNNQNNKKYDLGVLFVHGIGFQNPGDTFKTIFWPIKERLEELIAHKTSNGATNLTDLYYGATNNAPLIGVDMEVIDSRSRKSIAFRESYWHEANINKKGINFLGNINTFQAVLRLFFLKILQPRVSTIIFIIFAGFIIRSLSSSYFLSIFEGDGINWFIAAIIFGPLALGLIIVIAKKIPEIKSLWRQIQFSKLGYASNYIKVVSRDIRLIMNESENILIISHSMGGYLAYKALARINGFKGEICFVGMGSGLGPMSIIEYDRKGGKETVFCDFLKELRTNILVYLTLFSLLSIELVTLWFNLSLFFSHRWDNGSIFITRGLSGTPILMCIFINITMILFVYLVVYAFLNSGFKLGHLGEEAHYEFYYPADLVGNTSRFVYSRDINDARVGGILGLSVVNNIFKRVIFAHDMGYYMKNNTVIDSSSCLIGVGARIQNFSLRDVEKNLNKNCRKDRLFWIWLIILGIYGFQVLMDTYKEYNASLPFYAVIYAGPMFVFLEYVSYFILGSVAKTLIHLYCLKIDLNSRRYRAISFFAVDVSMIILMAPLLFINIYGRPGFLSKVALIVSVIVALILIAKYIKWRKGSTG